MAPGTAALLTTLVLVLALLAAGFVGGFSADPVLEPTITTPQQESIPTPSPSGSAGPPADSQGRFVIDASLAAGALLVLVMLGVALLVRWLLRFRGEDPPDGRLVEQTTPHRFGALAPVDAALPAWAEATRDALAGGGDTSDTVIRCWLDLERICARAGAGRRATQTTSDFAADVAAALDLPAEPLATLNRLYQRARFARTDAESTAESTAQPLGEGERRAAAESIATLSSALAGRDGGGTP